MKKGFTIIELLAVIVIISVLVTLTGISISKIVKKSKITLTDIQEKQIINAAKNYISSRMGINIEDGECKYLTISKLKQNGFIEDINNIGEIYIKIELDSDKVLIDYKYEIDDSIDDCIELN